MSLNVMMNILSSRNRHLNLCQLAHISGIHNDRICHIYKPCSLFGRYIFRQMLHAVSSSSSLISLSSFSLLFTIQSKSLRQLFDEFCFFAWCVMVSSWSLSKTSGVVNTSTSFAWTHLCFFLEIQLLSLCSQKIGELWLVLLLVVNALEGSQDKEWLQCSHYHIL